MLYRLIAFDKLAGHKRTAFCYLETAQAIINVVWSYELIELSIYQELEQDVEHLETI